jgi:hypothetical protein
MPNRFVPILQEHAPTPIFEFDRLVDEYGVLTVHLLAEDDRQVRLIFDDYLVYRKRDEGDALSTLRDAKDAPLGRSFYRVEESDFLAWFQVENHDIRRDRGLIHLVIMTMNDVIDVICCSDPRVEAARA